MKAAILSLAIALLPLWQADVFGCNKSGSTQGKKANPQSPVPTNGQFPLPSGIDPTQGQFIAVPVQSDPSNANSPIVYVLVPASNGQMPVGSNMLPASNGQMPVAANTAARPSHGRSKSGMQKSVSPSNGSMMANSPRSIQPSNGSRPQTGADFLQQQLQQLPTQQPVAAPSQPPAPIQQPERQILVSTQPCLACEAAQDKLQPQTSGQLMQLWTQMNTAPESTVRQALQSSDPLNRYIAAQAAGSRKINCPQELTALLSDSSPYVQQAARQSLAQLSR